METLKLSARCTLTLPSRLRKRYALKPHDLLLAEPTGEGILLKPALATPIELSSDEPLAESEQNKEPVSHNSPEETNSRQVLDMLSHRSPGFNPLPAKILDEYIQETRASWD